jgi:hypothetical protein
MRQLTVADSGEKILLRQTSSLTEVRFSKLL